MSQNAERTQNFTWRFEFERQATDPDTSAVSMTTTGIPRWDTSTTHKGHIWGNETLIPTQHVSLAAPCPQMWSSFVVDVSCDVCRRMPCLPSDHGSRKVCTRPHRSATAKTAVSAGCSCWLPCHQGGFLNRAMQREEGAPLQRRIQEITGQL